MSVKNRNTLDILFPVQQKLDCFESRRPLQA